MTDSSVQVPDFSLSPELQKFRDYVREFTDNHLGDARRYDAEVAFPRDPVIVAAEMGLLRTTVDKVYGGSEMGNVANCVMLEEINAACVSPRKGRAPTTIS